MYDQLDRSKNQIRLLRLSPGCASDVLMCDLFTVSMEEPNEYEALSYVWGSAGNVLPIVLDGQRKDVTENLESALRHLRNAEKQRVLWVDALCINQDDLEERVSQVQLMRQIYSGASQVVVWLRSNEDKDEPALDMIRRLGSDPRLHWTAIPMKKGMELLSLYMCIKSEWWSRIWTAQEAVLARRTVYQLGTVRLPGRLLINLATSYREHVHRTGCCNTVKKPWKYGSRIEVADDLRRIMDNMFQLRQLQLAPRTLNFDEVASMFRHRTATDTRDKVYGLLGISCGIAEGSIDYTITQARVYELATRDCMSHNKNLNILSHVIQHVRVGPAGWAVCWEKDEPSWVPDWTHGDTSAGSDVELTHYRANFLHHYNACGMLAYEPSLNDAVGKLHIRGTCCDTIATLSNAVLVRPLFLPTDQIKDWRSMVGLEEDPGRAYVGGDTVSEAFWRMLCLDIHVHSAPREDMATVVKRAGAENRELYLTHWYLCLIEGRNVKLKTRDSGFLRRYNEFADHLQKAIARRKFFVSQKGYMGFAPLGTKPGDRICVLAGGRAPLIVRAAPENDGKASDRFVCRLLGDAYVHGLMDGEAMKLVDDGVLKVEDFELI